MNRDKPEPKYLNSGIVTTSISLEMPAIEVLYAEPDGGRKARCPCGSGKKYKKCHGAPSERTKPRRQSVEVTFDNPVALDSMELILDPYTGEVSVDANINESSASEILIEHSYEREKGKKVIARATANGKEGNFDFARLLSRYDLYFAVDTNTRDIDGKPVSVSGIVIGICDRTSKEASKLVWRLSRCLEIRGAKSPPEKIGWAVFLRSFIEDAEYSQSKRYCLIVDSHLDEIEGIGSGLQPIVEELFLPENFDLAYATSDAGDHVHNKLLRLADKASADVLKIISRGDNNDGLNESVDPNYDQQRWWWPKP